MNCIWFKCRMNDVVEYGVFYTFLSVFFGGEGTGFVIGLGFLIVSKI